MRSSLAALLCFALVPCAGWSADEVPEGAVVRLEFDREEYLLGETIIFRFVLENTGSKPFVATAGGDYRGSPRAVHYTVTAVDEAGEEVVDPIPNPMSLGGIVATERIDPGEKFVTKLNLLRYREIVAPGRYTIRATHNFGWREGQRKRPVGEATIRLVEPSEQQAAELIKKMLRTPNPQAGDGDEAPDFSTIRSPRCLTALLTHAEDGEPRAVEGLASIATVPATRALIQLMHSPRRVIAVAAAEAVRARLPAPDRPWAAGWFSWNARPGLSSRAWADELVPALRAIAVRGVGANDDRMSAASAAALAAIGTADDADAIVATLDQRLGAPASPRKRHEHNLLDLPEPILNLALALSSLHGRGYNVTGELSGAGMVFAYFHLLAGDTAPRPDMWAARVAAHCKSSHYATRVAVLRSMPAPIPERLRWVLKQAFDDQDIGVVRTACEMVARCGDKSSLEPVMEIIATERDESLLRTATYAAFALGPKLPVLETWVSRLPEEGMLQLALDACEVIVEQPRGGHSGQGGLTRSERLALRREWQAFLAKHAAEIEAGKKFRPGMSPLPPELFGRARQWQLPDGRTWPDVGAQNIQRRR